MPKLILDLIANAGPSGIAKINENFDRLEDAIENTLSRDGTLPNQLTAALDVNHQSLLNIGDLDVDSITIQGSPLGSFNGTFKGLWSSVTNYFTNDVVRDVSGNLWIAKAASLNVPLAENASWTVFMPGAAVADGSVSTAKLQDGAVTTAKVQDGSVTSNKIASALKSTLVTIAPDRATLKALDTTIYKTAYLSEPGREGMFNFYAGNYTAQINNIDPLEGVYIKANAVAASAGSWVREFDEAINVKWFGAKGDYVANDTAAIQAAVDFHDQNLWKADAAGTTPTQSPRSPGYVLIPSGIFGVSPNIGIRLWDKTDIRGAGTASSFVKSFSSAAGNLFYRAYNGTSTGNGRVLHVHITGIKGIVIAANQIIFNLEHVGRGEIHHVEGGTQDRVDEFGNLKQRYWPGTALFKIGVKTSIGTGYINGSDVLHLHHFDANFLAYGIQGAASANMKQPEYLRVNDFEISDCHEPIVFNASAAMIGYVGNGVVQRWGNDSIRADTGLAGADGYGMDIVANKYKIENIYSESNSAFATVLIRAGSNNCILDVASMNRYGTTATIYSDGGTATKLRTT